LKAIPLSGRRHPACQIGFDDLLAGLRDARANRLVYKSSGLDCLPLYVCSEHCVFEGAWDGIMIGARGLILNPEARRVVATPFPNFFNVGERGQPIPGLTEEFWPNFDTITARLLLPGTVERLHRRHPPHVRW